jgi:SAM-dependent methyltransferase
MPEQGFAKVTAAAAPFSCPGCGAGLETELDDDALRCASCGVRVGDADGVLDLVFDPDRTDERAFYDGEYEGRRPDAERGGRDVRALVQHWTDPLWPEYGVLWDRLGDLSGKRVLLVGNGDSDRELYMLTQEPEHVVFSDLSADGVRLVRNRYDLSPYEGRITFAGLDAMNLPFPDGSLDVVYGSGIVHHLPDVGRFIAEVARVLRPGGRAVFRDDAYAPTWQTAKRTWLRPLMLYTHWREPVSPEDLRFTMEGGFREEVLGPQAREHGCEPWFHRIYFLYYFWTRALDRVFPRGFSERARTSRVGPALLRADRRLSRYEFVRKNTIRLIWGFDKPAR